MIASLKVEFEIELKNILDWWNTFMVDPQSGFYGKADINNQIDETAERGLVLYSRILYTFSKAACFFKEDKYRFLADRAYQYLQTCFLDNEHRGYVWAVKPDGTHHDTTKKTYGQSFVIYGLVAYYELNNDDEILEQALALFETIESKAKDPDFGGYIEAFGKNWQPIDDIRLSEKDANLPKSMNTHLHVLEAYTALYKVSDNKNVEAALTGLIDIFIDHIICPQTYHLHLFFTIDWTVSSQLWSYGHDIETSWLLIKAVDVLEKDELKKKAYALALQILEASLEGIAEDGAMIYETDYVSDQLIEEKHWWPQAEAMVGFWYGYKQTYNRKYLELIKDSWTYIQQNLIDHEKGEWYWGRDSFGNILHPDEKAGFWKCPYHSGRALMELIYNDFK